MLKYQTHGLKGRGGGKFVDKLKTSQNTLTYHQVQLSNDGLKAPTVAAVAVV